MIGARGAGTRHVPSSPCLWRSHTASIQLKDWCNQSFTQQQSFHSPPLRIICRKASLHPSAELFLLLLQFFNQQEFEHQKPVNQWCLLVKLGGQEVHHASMMFQGALPSSGSIQNYSMFTKRSTQGRTSIPWRVQCSAAQLEAIELGFAPRYNHQEFCSSWKQGQLDCHPLNSVSLVPWHPAGWSSSTLSCLEAKHHWKTDQSKMLEILIFKPVYVHDIFLANASKHKAGNFVLDCLRIQVKILSNSLGLANWTKKTSYRLKIFFQR